MHIIKLPHLPETRFLQWLPTALMIIIPLAIITVLVKLSPDFNKVDHGFKRVFITQQPRLWKTMDVAKASKYIAGITATDVYFSSMKPGQIERLEVGTGHTCSRTIFNSDRLSASCQAEVNGAEVRLFDAPSGLIITENEVTREIKVHQLPELFTRFVSISGNRVFLRKFVKAEKDQAFYKYDLQTKEFYSKMKLTADKNDGGLSTDGELVYDQTSSMLAYVEHNCNKMTLFDTAGNILKVAHSIDTFATNQFQADWLGQQEQGIITNSAPVQFVNQLACFDNGVLYVQSGVRSDDQSLTEFNSEVVIDLYNGKDGVYGGSIRMKGVKDGIRNWMVRKGILYLLSNNRLHIYTL